MMVRFKGKLILILIAALQLGCDAAISNWIGMRSNFRPDDNAAIPSDGNSPTTPSEFTEKTATAVLNNFESTYSSMDKVKFSADESLIYQIVYDGFSARVMTQSLSGGYPNILNLPIKPHSQRTNIFLTPDNQYFIYIANQVPTSPDDNIYAFKRDGGSFTKLNPSLVTNGDVIQFFYSSTTSRVVYGADADTDTKEEIYSVRLDGTGFIKLNTSITNGSINEWYLSPDQNTVFYRGKSSAADKIELYAAAVDGTNHRKISDTLQANGDVVAFKVSADGQWVAYIADQVTDGMYELFVVPVYTVSPSTKISTNLIAAGDVHPSANFFRISGDGGKIIYTADASVDEQFEVFAVNRDGTGHVKLNAALGANRDAGVLAISNDGLKAFFLSDGGATDNIWNLYSVNTDGTGVTTLIPDVANSTSTPFYPTNLPFRVSQSLQKVLMVADVDANSISELYSVNWDGTGLTKISPASAESIHFSPNVAFSADDQMVAFSFYNATYPRVFVVNSDGTGLVQLNTQGTSDEGLVQNFSFSQSGHRLAAAFPKTRIYTSNLSSYSEILPSYRQNGLGYVGTDYWISPDSGKLYYNKMIPGSTSQVFLADAEVDEKIELYIANTDGTQLKKLSRSLGSSDSVLDFQLSNQNVAYRVRRNDFYELYLVNVDGTGQSRVHGTLSDTIFGIDAGYSFNQTFDKLFFSDNISNYLKPSIRWVQSN